MRMPSCKEVTALVLAGADRDLDPLERKMLRIHWRVCEGCRHFASRFRLTRAALAQWRQSLDQ
jgi:hypothetical protein